MVHSVASLDASADGEGCRDSAENEAQLPENTPKLWDPNRSSTMRERLRAMTRTTDHTAWLGMYSAPTSMSVWQYRSYLRLLDRICLRALESLGALSAAEITEWLNRNRARLLVTRPKVTGIHVISEETVRDWLVLARRRGFVTGWPQSEVGTGGDPRSWNGRWAPTETGQAELRSPLANFFSSGPGGPLLGFVGGGVFVGLLNRLGESRTMRSFALFLGGVLLYTLILLLWDRWNLRRRGPGSAVVAIETFRCAKKPLPALDTAPIAPVEAGGT